MAFCTKCGAPLDDGAAFCSKCGAAAGAQAQPQAQPQTQAQPQEQPQTQAQPTDAQPQSTPAASVTFKLPDLTSLLLMGVALLAFICTSVPWISVTVWSYSQHFGILTANMFGLSALFGFAKIFMIIDIIVFIVYIITSFFDFSKLIPQIATLDIKRLAKLAYFGIYALGLVFTLIGIIATEYVGISAGWFFALIFAAAGLVFTFMPSLLDQIVGAVKKK